MTSDDGIDMHDSPYKLRPYQEPIAELTFNYMRRNPSSHPLIALPTGSGKTIVMAEIIKQANLRWPETNILVLSHVKEILSQNFNAIEQHTRLPVAVNSAGLKRRERGKITVAGIQSVYKQAYNFKHTNLIIIDECHLIPPADDSMYRTLFAGIDRPRYLGLTATPFRLGSGKIYGQNDSIFDDLIVDYTTSNKFLQLIKDGYLCDLRTMATKVEMDTLNISTRGGDFDQKEMSSEFNKENITSAACKEIVKLGQNRKKWLIFAIDIEHAESIATKLNQMNIPTLVMHSKMDFDRDWVVNTYKKGKVKAIVNVNVLTTGFDDPEIDLIALLRPTKSPVIHVQTIGRGLRIAPNKEYCLILDFAGNTERLGPINNIVIRKTRKGQNPDEVGDPPCRKCPKCQSIVFIKEKKCPWCGYEFPIATSLTSRHSKKDVIDRSTKKIDWFDVSNVIYKRHIKKNSPDMMKVSYICGMRAFNEYICLDHPGYAGHKAKHWTKFRGGTAQNVDELLKQSDSLQTPKKIKVDTRGKYPIIADAQF